MATKTSEYISLKLSYEAIEELEKLAVAKGISKEEVIRRALAVYDYLSDIGGSVLITMDDGSIESFLLP